MVTEYIKLSVFSLPVNDIVRKHHMRGDCYSKIIEMRNGYDKPISS